MVAAGNGITSYCISGESTGTIQNHSKAAHPNKDIGSKPITAQTPHTKYLIIFNKRFCC
jgi:hypothetical protein